MLGAGSRMEPPRIMWVPVPSGAALIVIASSIVSRYPGVRHASRRVHLRLMRLRIKARVSAAPPDACN